MLKVCDGCKDGLDTDKDGSSISTKMGLRSPHFMLTEHTLVVAHYPVRACAARGKVISRGWCPGGGVHKKSTVFFGTNLLSLKISLSELYFNTDRLLIEFNGLWYSLAARLRGHRKS